MSQEINPDSEKNKKRIVRKKVEDEIRRLKVRFELAQRAAGVGVWDWDVKTGHRMDA